MIQGIQDLSKLLGERGTILTKRIKISKLALEVIGYLILSLSIAAFSSGFLFSMSMGLVSKAVIAGNYNPSSTSNSNFFSWLQLICIIAGITIFLALFMFFLAGKISYILTITNAIQKYKAGTLDSEIDIIGNDELTELADSFNSFLIALSNHMKNEEQQKNEKEELIRALSHDIRTPLTSIISYSDFIKNKKYDNEEKLEAYAELIQNKAAQIDELTKLLLNQNIEYNNLQLLDGKLMFQQFINEFCDALDDNGFSINLDTIGLVNFKTNLDPQDISRIFDNLYSNILKYANNKEKINLKLSLRNNKIVLHQSNSINFQRTHKTDSHGIGLKSISSILNKYNGEMNYSITNTTYTFEFKIPYNL